MTLSAKDILGVASDSLARFGDAIIGTLSTPALAFAPPQGEVREARIPPDAMTFAVLSIVFGTALRTIHAETAVTGNALVTGMTILVILGCWLVFGLLFHQSVIGVGASGTPALSMSIVLQTLGAAYFSAHILRFVVLRIMLRVGNAESAIIGAEIIFILSQTLIIGRSLSRLAEICHNIARGQARIVGWMLAVIFAALNVVIFFGAFLVTFSLEHLYGSIPS